MTSEVVLMNSNCIALAADSATTISYWEKGEEVKRYFKGANKIFHMSNKAPVGLMIYNTANLQGVPWEVIIKLFREKTNDKLHNHLTEYSEALFSFLTSDENYFPQDKQREELIDSVIETTFRILKIIVSADFNEEEDDSRHQLVAEFDLFRTHTDNSPFIDGFDEEFISHHREDNRKIITEILKENPLYDPFISTVGIDKMYDLAFSLVFKEDWTTLSYSGLVVTGYGEADIFPKTEHYNVYGVLLNKVICQRQEKNCRAIDHVNSSEIIPIAQSDMLNTFMYGASSKTLNMIEKIFEESLDHFKDEFTSEIVVEAEILPGIKKEVRKRFNNKLKEYLIDNHTDPLKRIINMLPIDELADLAETLISLESLKERVTKPTESVSGPIDVAVISKGDGFIWMKRKHYFDPELNQRYFSIKGIR